MRRFILGALAISLLSASGCVMPGDWWPFGGIGATYDSNTADEASSFEQSKARRSP